MFNRSRSPKEQKDVNSTTIHLGKHSKITVFTVHKLLEKQRQQHQRLPQSPEVNFTSFNRNLMEKDQIFYQKKKTPKFAVSGKKKYHSLDHQGEENDKDHIVAKKQSVQSPKEKIQQQRLLNETMKIMNNNYYAASVTQNQDDFTDKMYTESLINKKQEETKGNQSCFAHRIKFNKKKTLRQKFKANLLKFHMNSIPRFCQNQLALNSFSCEIKGVRVGSTFSRSTYAKTQEKKLFIRKKGNTKKQKGFSYVISSPQIMLKKRTAPDTTKEQSMLKEEDGKQRQKLTMYQYNVKKMMQCLDVILLSFNCKMEGEKKEQVNSKTFHLTPLDKLKKIAVENNLNQSPNTYYYYLGEGNNHQLVKSVFRKRGWWVETDRLKKANLVWTQLKVDKVLVQMQEKQTIENTQSSKQTTQQGEQRQNKKLNKKITNLFHPNHQIQSANLNSISAAHNTSLQTIKCPNILHNHYQGNNSFGNKNNLFFNLLAYCSYYRKNIHSIIPLTLYVSQDSLKTVEYLQQAFEKHHQSIWIVKPAENSNRGNKIFLTTSIDEIKQKLEVQQKLIVQKYIKNLFLYEGRKFDIRTYLLAITINGRLKFYFYEEGYLRTSSYAFSTNNIKDRHVHLTNDPVQEQTPLYSKFQEGNKLSYSQFQRYLNNKSSQSGLSIYQLHDQMRKLSKSAVLACYPKLSQKNNMFGFQIFGLDFIVDSNFKPFLIQVNSNPCLELPSLVLQRVIPNMLENIFRLAVDPLFRPSSSLKVESYYLYDKFFLEKNKFRLIFDEEYDGDKKWEKYLIDNPISQTFQLKVKEECQPESQVVFF